MAGQDLVIAKEEDVIIAHITTPSLLDGPAIDGIRADIEQLINTTETRRLIIDFEKVSFLSSSMIGTLVSIDRTAKKYKVQLVLVAMRDSLQKVFKITKLDKVFTFATSIADAKKKMKWGV